MASIFDNYPSTLSPLQLTSTSSLLQNKGLRVNPAVTNAVSSYTAVPLISTWLSMQTMANAGTGGISAANAAQLANIASPYCAALADGIPQAYLTAGTFSGVTYPPGITGIITTKANQYLGSPTGQSTNWDTSRFAQILAACVGYEQLVNQFIISACNSDSYLCDTFSNTDNMTTGEITAANLATEAFGSDLANLGQLWNLADIDNLGSPLALVRQIINVVGTIPIISLTFIGAGVDSDVVVNLDNPQVAVSDSAQKSMYLAMTQITGDALTQILQLLGVTTAGLTTMADLLNPVKIFPNSFQSLTVTTKDGIRGVYLNSSGSVNMNLLQNLPPYILSSTV